MPNLTPDQLDAIARLAERATPGPWAWRGYVDGSIELRTVGNGGQRVVTTMRADPCVVMAFNGEVVLTMAACRPCRDEWEKPADAFVDYRCPKPENLDTVWLRDDDDGRIRPANEWAVREVPYRGDVESVDHPDAAYIAAVSPDVVLALIALARVGEHAERLAEALRKWHVSGANPGTET